MNFYHEIDVRYAFLLKAKEWNLFFQKSNQVTRRIWLNCIFNFIGINASSVDELNRTEGDEWNHVDTYIWTKIWTNKYLCTSLRQFCWPECSVEWWWTRHWVRAPFDRWPFHIAHLRRGCTLNRYGGCRSSCCTCDQVFYSMLTSVMFHVRWTQWRLLVVLSVFEESRRMSLRFEKSSLRLGSHRCRRQGEGRYPLYLPIL